MEGGFILISYLKGSKTNAVTSINELFVCSLGFCLASPLGKTIRLSNWLALVKIVTLPI